MASCGASRAATDTSRRTRQLAPRGIRQLAPSSAKGKRQTACAIVQSVEDRASAWSLSSDDEGGSRLRVRRGGGALKGGMPVSSSNTVAYAVIHTQATAIASIGVPGGKV